MKTKMFWGAAKGAPSQGNVPTHHKNEELVVGAGAVDPPPPPPPRRKKKNKMPINGPHTLFLFMGPKALGPALVLVPNHPIWTLIPGRHISGCFASVNTYT